MKHQQELLERTQFALYCDIKTLKNEGFLNAIAQTLVEALNDDELELVIEMAKKLNIKPDF